DGPGLHKVASDHARAADGGDQDVGTAADCRQIVGLGVTDGDSGISIEQQHGGGLAHDVAASDHHCFASGNGDIATLQNFHNARRGTRHEAGALSGKESDVHGMESVDVLRGIYRQQDLLRIDVAGQRQLDQNPVNVVAVVQVIDHGQQLRSRYRFRGSEFFAVDSDFFAGFDFAAYVHL